MKPYTKPYVNPLHVDDPERDPLRVPADHLSPCFFSFLCFVLFCFYLTSSTVVFPNNLSHFACMCTHPQTHRHTAIRISAGFAFRTTARWSCRSQTVSQAPTDSSHTWVRLSPEELDSPGALCGHPQSAVSLAEHFAAHSGTAVTAPFSVAL